MKRLIALTLLMTTGVCFAELPVPRETYPIRRAMPVKPVPPAEQKVARWELSLDGEGKDTQRLTLMFTNGTDKAIELKVHDGQVPEGVSLTLDPENEIRLMNMEKSPADAETVKIAPGQSRVFYPLRTKNWNFYSIKESGWVARKGQKVEVRANWADKTAGPVEMKLD